MLGVKQDTKHADLPEILTLIRKKNQAGFELLYAWYYRFLFSTAYMVLRQESDAMDAVQNAALRLYTMDESLFPSDHELAWLHTVSPDGSPKKEAGAFRGRAPGDSCP